MFTRRLALAVLLTSIVLAACSAQPAAPAAGAPVSVAGGAYVNISPAQLTEMLNASRKDFLFVNTHIPYAGEIAPTDAFIPYNETAPRLSEYPAGKNARIVL